MMERILKLRLPSTAIIFMLVMICTSVVNLIGGYEALSNVWVLQLFGFLVLEEVADFLIGKIDFKSYKTYFITETVILYVIFLLIAYVGNWFHFTVERIALVTLIFLGISAYIHYYFYRLHKLEAEELNEIIQKRE